MLISMLTPTNVSRILSGMSGTGDFWMNGTVPLMHGCCRRENWGWCPGILHKPSYTESSPWCEELQSTFPCHLYSIGIGDSWDFESKMKTRGCVVDAFDPTLELHQKHREFAKKNGIRFHFRGLGTSGTRSTRNSYGNVHAKRLRTLAHILGDAKDVLLKVDCEGCEWAVFSDDKILPVLRRVRLLFVELHVSPTMIPPQPGQVERFFTNMRNAGLYIWWLRHNPGYPRDQQVTPHLSGFLKRGACCYEMAFARREV